MPLVTQSVLLTASWRRREGWMYFLPQSATRKVWSVWMPALKPRKSIIWMPALTPRQSVTVHAFYDKREYPTWDKLLHIKEEFSKKGRSHYWSCWGKLDPSLPLYLPLWTIINIYTCKNCWTRKMSADGIGLQSILILTRIICRDGYVECCVIFVTFYMYFVDQCHPYTFLISIFSHSNCL